MLNGIAQKSLIWAFPLSLLDSTQAVALIYSIFQVREDDTTAIALTYVEDKDTHMKINN